MNGVKPDRFEVRRNRVVLGVVMAPADPRRFRREDDLPALARRLDAVAAVARDHARHQRGDQRAFLRAQERVVAVLQVQDLVLGDAIAEVPAPELLERMAHPQAEAEGVVVVLDERSPRAEDIEARGQRPVEQPRLGEADLALLHVGARADLDGGQPAPAQEVVLREIDGAERAVRGGVSAADREESRRPLRDVDVDDDLGLVGAGRRVDLDLFEVAQVGQALLAALHLPQGEDLALGHLQLSSEYLVLAADVAGDVDPLDVDGGALVDLEHDGNLVFGQEVDLRIHLRRRAADVRVEVLEGLGGVPQGGAREDVAGLELHLPPELVLRHEGQPGEANRRHPVLRALHHHDVDADARLLTVHLHVAVGELLDVRRDLDLEVALALVVVLHPLARALDVHGVVDAAELEVDLVLQVVGGDVLVADEVDVAHERPLHDDEADLHAPLEVLDFHLDVVEEAEREHGADVLGELGGTEGRADGRFHAAEDDRLLHAAIALDGELFDEDGGLLGGHHRREIEHSREHDDDDGKTQAPPWGHRVAQARAGWCLVLSKLEGSVGGLGLAEDELSSDEVHVDPSTLGHLPAHDRLGERILDVLLDRPPKLARSVLRVVALVHQGRLGGRREDQLDALLGELLVDPVEHQPNDLLDVRQRERVEHDDVVDPVDELRPERPLHLLHHAVLHLLVGLVVALLHEARRDALADQARAEVRRHDEDRVLEVDDVAEGVRQAAVVEHLQHHVEDVGMRLFDLVEEHHRIRAPPDLLGQEAALFVAHVAGRRAEQPGDGELLHVLRHVHADQRVLVSEQVLGERARQLGLADAGGAEEDERAHGALGVLEAGTGAADGARHRFDGVVLADDPAVQRLFHARQLRRLLLLELAERDARPARDDELDVFFAHRLGALALVLLPVALHLLFAPAEDLLLLAKRRGLHDHGLEAALEGAVLLDVLAVLVQRGGADRLDLAPRERRLEHVRRVDGAFGGAGADQRVQLVEEQDHVLRLADLLHHGLQPLLELAAVLRAGHEGAEVELQEPLVHEHVGDVVRDDFLRETLDDGRLAHARLADEHRVVLRAPRQDLDDALDLLLAPDDGVELGLAGELREVARELVEHRRLRALLRPRVVLVAEQRQRLLTDLVQAGAERLEDLGRDRLALFHEAQQQVLGPDVIVTELTCLFDGQFEDALVLSSEGNFTERERLAELSERALHLGLHGLEAQAQALEDGRRDAFTVTDEAEKNVFGPHEVVPEPPRFFSRQDDDSPRPFGEPFKHWCPPPLFRVSVKADFALGGA